MVLGGLLAGGLLGGGLAGCGGATSSGAASTPPPTVPTTSAVPPAAGTSPAGPARTVVVTGRRIRPAPSTVDLARGQTLRLTLTVDRDDRLHAHGLEVERDVRAGRPVTVDLTATTTGAFEVELHDPPLRLFTIAVR